MDSPYCFVIPFHGLFRHGCKVSPQHRRFRSACNPGRTPIQFDTPPTEIGKVGPVESRRTERYGTVVIVEVTAPHRRIVGGACQRRLPVNVIRLDTGDVGDGLKKRMCRRRSVFMAGGSGRLLGKHPLVILRKPRQRSDVQLPAGRRRRGV